MPVARCLPLNASFEPVALVAVKRAIVLVVSEKAEIVEADLERRFRSERAEYPYPLVIRLISNGIEILDLNQEYASIIIGAAIIIAVAIDRLSEYVRDRRLRAAAAAARR